jgi:glutamate 5-kinase
MSIWVIKAGSQMVLNGGSWLIHSWMEQAMYIQKKGFKVIWVTSGAIASAADRIQFNSIKKTLAEKQALSALGQPIVMDLYNKALHSLGAHGAQILLTASDIADENRKKNLLSTLNKLLDWNIIPIINENDSVATEEIQFGDNDQLSALVAKMIGAKKLILLTDVMGLFDSDPKKNPNAYIIPEVTTLTTQQIEDLKSAAESSHGRGGMYSKVLAAQKAQSVGIDVHLCKGDEAQVISKIFNNQKIGTLFKGQSGVGNQ